MSAIKSTLKLIQARLDSYLKLSDPRPDDWVVVSNVVDHKGNVYEPAKDKIVLCLAGIQHETTISTPVRTTPIGGNQHAIVSPPLYINLQVLFLANFYDKSYVDGLEMIARTISFFQQNPYFTRDTLPDLDPVIDKLTFELTDLDFLQANHVMGMLGVHYLPCVLYRIRMIPFRGEAIAAVVSAAKSVDVDE